MSSKKKVRDAQRLIIDYLVECETSIADLYAAYGNAFPEMADFWQTLSDDEKGHARLLKTLHAILDKGDIFFNLGRFDKQTVNANITKNQTELATFKEKPFSVLHAIAVALSMEASLVDGNFYASVTSDAPEFISIADNLLKDTNRHIDLIKDQWSKRWNCAGGP